MGRNLSTILTGILVITFAIGCNTSNEPEATVTTEKLHLDVAETMIKELEEPIIQLTMRESISWEEYKAFQMELDGLYHAYSESVISCFFDGAEVETEQATLTLVPTHFYPTIYHQDMEITDAYVEKYEFEENPFFDTEQLYIELSYLGDNPHLADFERTYFFKKTDEDEWYLDGFSGLLNVADGEVFHPNYLSLKEE